MPAAITSTQQLYPGVVTNVRPSSQGATFADGGAFVDGGTFSDYGPGGVDWDDSGVVVIEDNQSDGRTDLSHIAGYAARAALALRKQGF